MTPGTPNCPAPGSRRVWQKGTIGLAAVAVAIGIVTSFTGVIIGAACAMTAQVEEHIISYSVNMLTGDCIPYGCAVLGGFFMALNTGYRAARNMLGMAVGGCG